MNLLHTKENITAIGEKLMQHLGAFGDPQPQGLKQGTKSSWQRSTVGKGMCYKGHPEEMVRKDGNQRKDVCNCFGFFLFVCYLRKSERGGEMSKLSLSLTLQIIPVYVSHTHSTQVSLCSISMLITAPLLVSVEGCALHSSVFCYCHKHFL